MQHVPRTHRVDLDGLFDRLLPDRSICMHFVWSEEQVADFFTQGSFSESTWTGLIGLPQVWKLK